MPNLAVLNGLISWRQKKATQTDLCKFFRVVRRYNSAGISMLNSVELHYRNCENEAMKAILQDLLRDMRNGRSFADALRKQPFFPPYIMELIRVAEEAGQMRKVLDEVVFFLEQNMDIKREVNVGLYPAKFFLVGAFLAVCLAIFVLIPKMSEIMTDLNAELPMLTSIVLNTGLFIAKLWPLLIIMALGGVAAYRHAKKVMPDKLDRMRLKIPFFGEIEYFLLQYKLTKILSLVLQSGIPMKEALKYTAVAIDHIPLRNTLHAATNRMRDDGNNTAEALRKADEEKLIHPDLFVMFKAGEESGNMIEILQDEAEDYRKEVLALSKNIGGKVGTAIIVPGMVVMLIVMGSIYMPLLRMMSAATESI